MLFSEEAWERTLGLREAIHHLPFNTELAAGTLRPERFRFYIMQERDRGCRADPRAAQLEKG